MHSEDHLQYACNSSEQVYACVVREASKMRMCVRNKISKLILKLFCLNIMQGIRSV